MEDGDYAAEPFVSDGPPSLAAFEQIHQKGVAQGRILEQGAEIVISGGQ
jgi:hypothetical protein